MPGPLCGLSRHKAAPTGDRISLEAWKFALIADLKTTILFGMWSIIPYFVYLATLYVLVDRMRLEATLALATVAWLMAATVLVTLWVRMH